MSLSLTSAGAGRTDRPRPRRAPVEACGYLGARRRGGLARGPHDNADASPEHFTLVPAEQFAGGQGLPRRGFACARSTTAIRPVPPDVAEDLRLAADPSLSYVIVSLAESEPVVKSFTVAAGVATEEPVVVISAQEG